MGQKYQTSPSRKCTSFINNARSFFIKLVHFQHASPKKADDDPQPAEDAATETLANQQPPAYEVAMQTPSHLPENALRGARHDTSPQERLPCSTAASDSMILERLCPPPRSYTRSPLSSMRPSSVLPTRRSREDAELLDDRRSPRPSFSRPSCSISIDNPRRGNKRFMAHKLIKASSASSLNSPRHLGTNAHSSTITRRDRELLAAKKSLPILTKYDKPSRSNKNSPLL